MQLNLSYNSWSELHGPDLDAKLPGRSPAHNDSVASKLENIASMRLHDVRQ